MSRQLKDTILNGLIWASAAASVGLLIWIISFIFLNGWSLINVEFLTNDFEAQTQYVEVSSNQTFEPASSFDEDTYFSQSLGFAIKLDTEDDVYEVVYVDEASPLTTAKNNANETFKVEEGYILEQIKTEDVSVRLTDKTSTEDLEAALGLSEAVQLKVTSPGGGIYPMIVSTLILIAVALLFAAPIGILAAIYMVEYAKPGRLVRLIRFATEILSGIPSIIYGLFGFLVFVQMMQLGMSLLAGGLTLMILLLPTMMRTTEEALKAVPMSYREASYGLGANKIQTLSKVILPSAIPGILVGVILSIGRTIGESAALLFTIGTFAKIPTNPDSGMISLFETGTSLTVRAYVEVKESGNVEMAAAIGIVILVIVFVLNMLSRYISKKFSSANY